MPEVEKARHLRTQLVSIETNEGGGVPVASTRLLGCCTFPPLAQSLQISLAERVASEIELEPLHSPRQRHKADELLIVSPWQATQRLASTKVLSLQSSTILQAESSSLSYNVSRSKPSPPKTALQSDIVWFLAIFKTSSKPCLPQQPMYMSRKKKKE